MINKTNRTYGSNRGFTLPEVLVVVAITAILGTILLANTREPERKFDVKRGIQTLSADLRQTQGFSISAQSRSCGAQTFVPYYGFRVQSAGAENTSYFIFADCDKNYVFDTSGSDDFIIASTTLNNVFISSTTPSSGGSTFLDIVYIPPNPDLAINGSTFIYPAVGDYGIELCHVGDATICSSVWGNSRGNIEVQ